MANLITNLVILDVSAEHLHLFKKYLHEQEVNQQNTAAFQQELLALLKERL